MESRLEADINYSQKYLKCLKNCNTNQVLEFSSKVERQLTDRITLWEKIKNRELTIEEAQKAWTELEESELFTSFLYDELQNKLKQIEAFKEALEKNKIGLAAMFDGVEDEDSLKTILLDEELPEKISHLIAVIQAIENGELISQERITEEMRDTIRNVFINREMVEKGEVSPLSVGAMILEVYEYEQPFSSFLKWLDESETELRYIEDSIESVVFSELVIPDIIGAWAWDILREPYHAEVYAQTGMVEDIKKETLKKIGSNEKEISFWKEKGLRVSLDEESCGNGSQKITGYEFKMNAFLLPYMKLFWSNKEELKETVLYGTIGKQEYCTVVENIRNASNDYFNDLEKNHGEIVLSSAFTLAFRKILNDILVNKIVGHRYATDLGEFIINFGNKEDFLYGKKVLEKISALRIEEQIVVETKDGKISFWNMEFIEQCVSLPEYWCCLAH